MVWKYSPSQGHSCRGFDVRTIVQISADVKESAGQAETTPVGTEQRRIVFVWQNETGAYAESALREAYGGVTHEAVPVENFEAAFEAVESCIADSALIPIEDSMRGSLYGNYDLLLKHRDLHIVQEINYSVGYCLAAQPSVQLKDVSEVIGHPKALSQCSKYLADAGVNVKPSPFTKGSATRIKNANYKDVACVVSEGSAQANGLDILETGIEDEKSITRFLVVERVPREPSQSDPCKTSIVFSLPETTGILFKALAVFALRDINLSKIESRPTGNGLAYAFYIDLQAHVKSPVMENALRHLSEMTTWMYILGCYECQPPRTSPSDAP